MALSLTLSKPHGYKMTGEAYTRSIVKRSRSTFAWSFYSLSSEQKRGMYALYAFARTVDDVVDEPWELAVKERQLAFWRGQVELAATTPSRHPMTMELAYLISHFAVTANELATLIDGVAMDCHHFFPATRSELERYCYGVAGVVGIMCLKIFGVYDKACNQEAAIQLGNAFQCTNILRDVSGDAKIGRCYFPQDELLQAGLSANTLLTHREKAQVFLQSQCERAWDYFHKAWERFDPADRSALLPARVMSVYYEAILAKITVDPAQVLDQRVGLSTAEKFWLLMTAWRKR